MFKDKPEEWYTLPTTRKGLMMIPLTKEACERHTVELQPPPPPVGDHVPKRKRDRKKKMCTSLSCEECKGSGKSSDPNLPKD